MSFILIRIGRKSDNDIVLTNSSVSGRHAEIFVNEEGIVFLTDLDSTNGTFINGNIIEGSVLLKKGDILRFGADKPVPWLTWVEKKQAEMSQPPMNPLSNPEDFLRVRSRKSNLAIWLIGFVGFLFVCVFAYFIGKFISDKILKEVKTESESMIIRNEVKTAGVHRYQKIIFDTPHNKMIV
jgi:pSer/pThr/pTyr-binding forkhead associated (FHA) protein